MKKTLNIILVMMISMVAQAETLERIVAVVNSEIILESDFNKLTHKLKNTTLLDDSLVPDGNLDVLKGNRRAQLEYLINEKIMDSEVKRLNLSASNERLEQEMKDLARRNNLSKEDLLKAVKSEGITVSDYQEFLKSKIERQSLIEGEIISKLRITDEEALLEYMKKNQSAKQSLNEFSLAHIFFNPKKGGADAAKERAERVLQKLQGGGSFETLAEQFSEDPNFSNGGVLGTFKSGEFIPEIEAAVTHLKTGETTPIVKSKIGFHIVKLLSKKVTADPKFEREKELIKSQLMETNFRRQLKIWLQSKKEDSVLRINDPSLK